MTVTMGRGGFRWKHLCRLVYETYGPICHILSVITRYLVVLVGARWTM